MLRQVLAALLSAALFVPLVACGVTGGSSSSGVSSELSPTPVEPDGFDASKIILRFGVISDLHLSYSHLTGKEVFNNCDGYADVMADLYHLSGGNLDAVMMCGDYTSLGLELQARNFAGATKTIVDGIFGDKPPKLIIGMGNHDTCWGRATATPCMNDAEWYRLLGEYGLNSGLEPDSDTDLGNLHVKIQAGEKTYHFLYVETENYAENSFNPKTLTWLGNLLKEITTEHPDQFVFVGTHGQVLETGCYGTDVELEGGAVWSTAKGNLDTVLSRFPQVVLFTGHSHFTEYLETTIMQRKYTALNVSAALSQSFYNSSYTKYEDSPYHDKRQRGMGYYIEVDANGAMRIHRVDFSLSGDTADVTGDIVKNRNPAFGVQKNEQEDLYTVSLDSCTLTGNTDVSVFKTPWVIKAPDEKKEFLTRYSDARGDIDPPAFPKGAKVTVTDAKPNSVSVYFPTASSEGGANILRYWVRLTDEGGNVLKETYIIGNWVDIKTGVVKGNDHTDAESLLYEIKGFSAPGTYYVTIFPVDEYGNRGRSITGMAEL